MYFCELCGYKTHRRDAFNRHENSNKHIHNLMCCQDVPSENVVPNSANVVPNSENVVPISENVSHSKNKSIYNCNKCNKKYHKKEYLKEHEKKCKGIDCLTCPKCMKTFADRKIKSKHCKRNTCKPVSIFEADNVKSIINNNYNTTNNTNTNTNTNSNNNNTNSLNTNITNVYINDYGKERKDYLLDYNNFYDIIKVPNNNVLIKYLKCKNFNPQFPENHCIKYENRRFKMKENDRWSLINANALKDKLFYDCGTDVLNVFNKHENEIKNQISNNEQYEYVKKKSNFIELQMEGTDKEIKNRMLDVVKDDN